MADRPEDFPEWALVEETDPVSGQSNIVEPPESYKNSGWTRAQIPPRQWFNWLSRRVYDWLFYLDDERADIRKEENDRYAGLVTRNWFAAEGLSGAYTINGSYNGVCWGDSGFVAVFRYASADSSARSGSGEIWEAGDLPSGNWTAVGYAPGISLYIAGNGDGDVATSSDGLAWGSAQSLSGFTGIDHIAGVNFSGTDYAIVAGFGASRTPRIAWSDDGSTWSVYEVESGYSNIRISSTGSKDSEGRMVALSDAGSGDIRIIGFTSPSAYTEIGSFSSPDLASTIPGAVTAIEFDASSGLYVLIANEDPGSGDVMRLYTSPDASSWTMRKEFDTGAFSPDGRLLYVPEVGKMIIVPSSSSGYGELFVTDDYELYANLNWTPGGDSGTGYPAIAWSPRYHNFVALSDGDTSTDTVTLRSL